MHNIEQPYAYACGNSRCRLRGQLQFKAMKPSDARLATGQPVKCRDCNQVVTYKPEQNKAGAQ